MSIFKASSHCFSWDVAPLGGTSTTRPQRGKVEQWVVMSPDVTGTIITRRKKRCEGKSVWVRHKDQSVTCVSWLISLRCPHELSSQNTPSSLAPAAVRGWKLNVHIVKLEYLKLIQCNPKNIPHSFYTAPLCQKLPAVLLWEKNGSAIMIRCCIKRKSLFPS